MSVDYEAKYQSQIEAMQLVDKRMRLFQEVIDLDITFGKICELDDSQYHDFRLANCAFLKHENGSIPDLEKAVQTLKNLFGGL